MFNSAQRTLSHGCLRVRNPLALAEMILKEDKGWDKDKIAELDRSGPLNNEVVIDKRIPIHLVYFTEWVDDAGKLKTYKDIYGHEKRIGLALRGAQELEAEILGHELGDPLGLHETQRDQDLSLGKLLPRLCHTSCDANQITELLYQLGFDEETVP